jgi:transposase
VRPLAALLNQTARKVLAELERLDPDNPTAAIARLVFDSAEAEQLPSSTAATQREYFDRRRVERAEADRKAAELYQSGASLLEVGRACGHSTAWVTCALARQGVAVRPRGHGPAPGFTRNPERIERLRAMRAEGKTLEQMGAAEHITRERVRQLCKANGIDTSPLTAVLDERQLQAVADYLAGGSLEFVATKYGVGTGAIRDWVLRAGHVPRRRKRRIAPETQAASVKAASLYRQGLKASEIAEQLGLRDQAMIYRLLAIAGVTPDRNLGAGKAVQQ